MIRQAAIAGFLIGMLAGTPAWADGAIKIGFVNVEAVMLESKTGIQFKADMEKFNKDKTSALRKEEEKLKEMKAKFDKEMMTLTDAQKQEREKTFQEKYRAYQQMGMGAENELRTKQTEYQKSSIEAIRQISGEIAKAEKLSAVFVTGAALYIDNGLDITQKVSEKFDKRPAKK